MPHVKISLEDRLEKLTRHCADRRIEINLVFDPTEDHWLGFLDSDGEEYNGDLASVVEAFEAELEL